MSTKNKIKQGAKGKPKPKMPKKTKPQSEKRQSWKEEAIISRVPAHIISGNRDTLDRKSCEQDFIAARIDPIRYNGRLPCHIGATSCSTVPDRSKSRLTMVVGLNGTGFVAVNPYRSPAFDSFDMCVTGPLYNTPDIDFTVSASSQVFLSSSRGGLFDLDDLGSGLLPISRLPSARIIACGMRLTPTSPVTKISGTVYSYQLAEQPSNNGLLGTTTMAAVDIINDYSKDVVVLNADQRCLEYTWTPPGEAAEDWVPTKAYETRALEKNQYTDVLYIQGAEPGASFLVEYVCYYEYRAPSLASMSRPSHQNPALSASVNTFVQKNTVKVSDQTSTGYVGMLEKGGNLAYNLLKDIGKDAVTAYLNPPKALMSMVDLHKSRVQELD